jgi:small subunit ribosomal protein S6
MSVGGDLMRNYEAMVIVDPRLDDAAVEEAVAKFTAVIDSQGELVKTDMWGRRRLAYEIDHQGEGYYVVAGFRSSGELVEELDRLFEIGEEYLRAKIVRIPDGATPGAEPSPEPPSDDAVAEAAEGGSEDVE